MACYSAAVTPERLWVQWEVLRDCVAGVDPSYLTLKTRLTGTDSPEFDEESTPPVVRVGGLTSLEWDARYTGGGDGGDMSLVDHSVVEVCLCVCVFLCVCVCVCVCV